MFSIRWRKVLRDLTVNKLRTALVVLSIAAGVFGIGMVEGTGEATVKSLNAAYAATNPASAVIYADGIDDALVDAIRRQPGVAAALGRRSLTVRAEVEPGVQRRLTLYAYGDLGDIAIDRIAIEQGRWPPRIREVVLERASLRYLATTLNDSIQIELPDQRRRALRVAGSIYQMANIPPFWANNATGFISLATLEALGYSGSYNELQIIVPDARTKDDVERVANRVRDTLEKVGVAVQWAEVREPGKHWASDNFNAMGALLNVLSIVTLLLSALLVINTISALVLQQQRQIGVMKAIGAHSGQIVRLYLGTTLIYSLLALLIAIPLGSLGGAGMGGFTTNMLNLDAANTSVSVTALRRQVLAGLAVPLIAALYPIYIGTRISVRAALDAYGLGRGRFGQARIDRRIEQVRGLARPLLLSLRNTFRRKGRLALTLATLTLAGATFISVLTVRDSLRRTMEDALRYWAYDIELNLDRDYRIEQIEREAQQVPGVVDTEVWGFQGAQRVRADQSESGNLLLVSLPATTQMLKPQLLAGRWLLPSDENAAVINSEVVKLEADLQVGQSIVLTIGGRESTWHVVGLVRGLLTAPIVYTNQPYAERILGNVGRGTRLNVVANQHDAAAQQAVNQALRAHFEEIGLRVGSSDTTQEQRVRIIAQFDVIVVFLLVMAILLAFVGGLGLMGTMSINVIERRREIGVLRAIGAGSSALVQIVMIEGVLIGLISWVLGLALALPASVVLTRVVGEAFLRQPVSYQFSFVGVLVWLGLAALLAALASLLPARSATRVSVREVLAYE